MLAGAGSGGCVGITACLRSPGGVYWPGGRYEAAERASSKAAVSLMSATGASRPTGGAWLSMLACAPTPSYRYADADGPQLFVAGQVPTDAGGALVGVGDVRAQADRCLDNLHTLIRVHGFELDDIRRLLVYVVGEHQALIDAWEGVTAWFSGEVPRATLLGVHLLGYHDQLVEIDATIVRRDPFSHDRHP